MKGDKGTCSAGVGENLVRRTKFDTQKHAQDACDFHVAMSFAHSDSIVYHCKVCRLWHFGKPAFSQMYSVKK